jgi:ABC-type Fe3+-hydroxamate transport system substrate-binding protein
MQIYHDQTSNLVRLPNHPHRIISLVPSLTELLFDLGLDQEIVGVTRYCIHPQEKLASRVKVGGIHQIDFKAIDALHPDLIIANKEENNRQEILHLQEKYPVYVSDIYTLEDALGMIADLGKLTNHGETASKLIAEIAEGFSHLQPAQSSKVAYLIWKNPFHAAGGNTFIHDLLKRSGFINIFENLERYPQVSTEVIGQAQIILLSSEPYPFSENDVEEFRNRFPASQVFQVDGTMFAWYGSRLRHTSSYINQLLNKIR